MSTTPKLSLVVPTLRRSDVLGSCLTTLLEQDYDDFEIVVQNNGRDPATENLVRDLAGDRVRHCWSDAVVKMADNWEAGIGNARGEFIAIIGDGDGVFPDCCRIAAEVLDRTGLEIVSWLPFLYYWPGFVRPDLRNRLFATVDYTLGAQIVQSESLLRSVYRFEVDFWQCPTIYNTFVRRSVIERAVATSGRYLLSPAPDVSSGIINLTQVAQFARLGRPLSVVGLSHHSTAGNRFLSGRGRFSREVWERDIGVAPADERVVAIENVDLFIANEMLLKTYEPLLERFGLDVDFRRLLQRVAENINFRPSHYDQTCAEIRALAKRHGIDPSEIPIPPQLKEVEPPESAAVPVGPNRVRFVIDGNALGLRTSADAVRRMQQFVPRLGPAAAIAIKDQEGSRGALRRGWPLTFRHSSEGALGLAYGWAEPEEWGAWSASKRALLRLAAEPDIIGDLHLVLAYRAYVQHGTQPDLSISCRVQGREVAAWSCGPAGERGLQPIVIPASAISSDKTVDLEFHFMNPRSPAQHGHGSDHRLLGIGIESLEVVDPSTPLQESSAPSFPWRLRALLASSKERT